MIILRDCKRSSLLRLVESYLLRKLYVGLGTCETWLTIGKWKNSDKNVNVNYILSTVLYLNRLIRELAETELTLPQW